MKSKTFTTSDGVSFDVFEFDNSAKEEANVIEAPVQMLVSDYSYIVGPVYITEKCCVCHKDTSEYLYNRKTKQVYCPICEETVYATYSERKEDHESDGGTVRSKESKERILRDDQ